jgi:hypothetical protein
MLISNCVATAEKEVSELQHAHSHGDSIQELEEPVQDFVNF